MVSNAGWLCRFRQKCLLIPIAVMIAMGASQSHAYAQEEFRGLWCMVFDPGYKSAGEVDQLISYAVQGNYNAILPQVLAYHCRTGGSAYGAFWRSEIVPTAPAVTDAFDPLAYLCQQAHAHGIEVHPWIIPYRVSLTWPPPGNSYLADRPEWFMVSQADLHAGTPAPIDGAYTLDPGSPDVQEYVVSIVRELIAHYPIDGINFDRIRYQQTDAGYPVSAAYAKSSLARFQQITGYVGTPSPSLSSWSNFRRRTIDELIRRCRAEIASFKDHPRQPIRLSADTIVWGNAPLNFTSTSAYGLFQNWQLWMQQGWLDTNVPMNYKADHCSPQGSWYRNWNQRCLEWGYQRHTVIGQATYMNTKSNSIAQMSDARTAGVHGTVNYNYRRTAGTTACPPSGLNDMTWYAYVRDNLFTSFVPTPAMPWRHPATATEGTIWGRVTDAYTGEPLDDATVTVGPIPPVRTDGNGIYVVTLVSAPTNGFSVQPVTVEKQGLPTGMHPAAYVFAGDIVQYDFALGAGPPTLELAPTSIARTVFPGDSLDDDIFTVGNNGDGPLNYTIVHEADWLTVIPNQGTVHSQESTITIRYDTGRLSYGENTAVIEVFDEAANPPGVTLAVSVRMEGVPGDFDGDGDVDMDDFGRFQACLTGPNAGPPPDGCERARLSGNDHVDRNDLLLFLGCMTGAAIPGDPDCAGFP